MYRDGDAYRGILTGWCLVRYVSGRRGCRSVLLDMDRDGYEMDIFYVVYCTGTWLVRVRTYYHYGTTGVFGTLRTGTVVQ